MNAREAFEAAERVMTPAQWLAFHLHHREGLPVATIASGLGVSPQAVRERLKKGTERLRVEKARLEMEEAA